MKLPQWLSLAALIAAVALLWSLREVILMLFAGIVIAMALCTLVGLLRARRPMARPTALLICLGGVIALIAVVSAVVIPPFIDEFTTLLQQLPKAARELVQLVLGGVDQISDAIYGNNAIPDLDREVLNSAGLIPDSGTLASGVSTGLVSLLGLAGNLGNVALRVLFTLAVALMVSVQPKAYRDVAILLIPSFYRRRAKAILLQCGEALSSWMVGVLISSFAVSLLCGLALTLLGVKLVLANALLAGLLNVIPNVGPTMSTVFPMAVALLEAPWKSAAVLGAYILIQNIESYVITPSVMQHQVKLLPGLTLAAQFIFTVIFGPLGLLMALPLAVVLQVLVREILIRDVMDRWRPRRLKA